MKFWRNRQQAKIAKPTKWHQEFLADVQELTDERAAEAKAQAQAELRKREADLELLKRVKALEAKRNRQERD